MRAIYYLYFIFYLVVRAVNIYESYHYYYVHGKITMFIYGTKIYQHVFQYTMHTKQGHVTGQSTAQRGFHLTRKFIFGGFILC